jgi:hypothetical protein
MYRIILFINLFLLSSVSPIKSDFTGFMKFVDKNFRPSESVKRHCHWQYAIVKVHTDKENVITDYHIENNVSNDFKFLIGYKILNQGMAGKHHLVFFESLENNWADACDIPPTNSHESPEKVFKQYRLKHKQDIISTNAKYLPGGSAGTRCP